MLAIIRRTRPSLLGNANWMMKVNNTTPARTIDSHRKYPDGADIDATSTTPTSASTHTGTALAIREVT
jgi:hypothetical protein